MSRRFTLFFLALHLLFMASVKAQSNIPYNRGEGQFVYTDYAPLASRKCTVFYYVPNTGDVSKMKVLFSSHGAERDGRLQRNVWKNLAEEYGFVVLAPQFSDNQGFGENNYQFGGVSTRNFGNGTYIKNNTTLWTYHIIEGIFDHFKAANASIAQKYDMFGHSAGGQFVHRFNLMMPNARVNKIFVANPGNYTYPDKLGLFAPDGTEILSNSWPFTLKGTDFDADYLQREFYKKELILGIGALDTANEVSTLPYNHPYVVQGLHRRERALKYFNYNKEQARLKGYQFNWKLQEVPNVGHSSRHMINGYPGSTLTRLGAFEALFSKNFKIVIPDLTISSVYKVMDGTVQVAQVTKEYLLKAGVVNAQAIVVYPVKNNIVQLNKGYVARIIKQYNVADNTGDYNFTAPTAAVHGGKVSFSKATNAILSYTQGSRSAAVTTVYIDGDGEITHEALPGAKNTSVSAHLLTDVRAAETNTYPIVKIGTQYWMAKNLNTRRYNAKLAYNLIPTAETTDIAKPNTAIYLQPNADATDATALENRQKYGLYYSYLAIGAYPSDASIDNTQNYQIDDKIAPEGWIVPSYIEALALKTYIGGNGKMLRLRAFRNNDGSINNITSGRLDDNITGFDAPNASYRNGNSSWAALLAENGAWFATRTLSATNNLYVFHMNDIISSTSFKTRNYTIRALSKDAIKTADDVDFTGQSYNKTIYVSELGGASVRNGSSWATAYNKNELQTAIDTANEGDQVWVAKGTYKPTKLLIPTGGARDKSFLLKEGVKVYGGFAGNEGEGYDLKLRNLTLNETILSGDLNNNNVTDNSDSYHVVVSAKNIFGSHLNGFTIKHGNANASGSVTVNGYTIYRNTGGGLTVAGANTDADFSQLSFNKNKSSLNGGAIHVVNDSTRVNFNRNKFINNEAQSGGAVFVAGKLGKVTVANSIFAYNKATTGDGGAIHHSRANAVDTSYFALLNSTFYKNFANSRGGAVSQNGYTNISTEVYNNLFYDNTSIAATYLNDIRISSVTKRYVDFNKYSDIPTTSGLGANNTLITNPALLFESLDTLNTNFLKLVAGSEAIDLGQNAKAFMFGNQAYNFDVLGNTRFRNNTIDLGAFEYQAGSTAMPTAATNRIANNVEAIALTSAINKSENKLSIYPNPVKNGLVNISLSGVNGGNYRYVITNTAGATVQQGTLLYAGMPITLSLRQNMPKSIYILKVYLNKTSIYSKLIIE